MKIQVNVGEIIPNEPVRPGNVYPIKGGRGMKDGHMQVVLAVTEPKQYSGCSVLLLVVDKSGLPVGVNSYALHYVQELCPIAFVDGLEDMCLTMRSL